MKKVSLKFKITLWFTLVLIVMAAVLLSVMTQITESVFLQETEKHLVSSIEEFERTIFAHYSQKLPIPEKFLYDNGVQIAIYDYDGNVMLGRDPFGIDKVEFKKTNTPRTVKYNEQEYYLLDKEIVVQNNVRAWVRGVASITDKTLAIDFTTNYSMVFILIFTALTGFGGYILLDKALKPVEKIRSTAQVIIESSSLSDRIDVGEGKDELAVLATTFNTMLDKIETTFEKEKQFTSDASHELRTPISVILSQCEYIEECVDDIDEAKEAVGSIKEQTNKMSKLISELLWIARTDSKKVNLHVERINVSELLQFICEEQEEIHGPNITLKRAISPNIFANCDTSMFSRLFINLISNAYQYNKENGNILVSLTETDKEMVFVIKDSGIGIPQDSLDKIWDRFYQVDQARTSDGNGSSGLGLSMVKWISDNHHGVLDIQSTLGKGTTIIFTMNKTINSLS